MNHRAGLLLAMACGLTAARGLAADPPVRATAQTTGDTCAATITGETLLVEIATERGIGRATVVATAGKFPEKVTLRLRYTTGKPLPTLEGLTISTGEFTIEGATARADEFQLTRRGALNKDSKPLVFEKQKVVIRHTDAALDIDLPQKMLGDAKQFNLQWVDYYRN